MPVLFFRLHSRQVSLRNVRRGSGRHQLVLPPEGNRMRDVMGPDNLFCCRLAAIIYLRLASMSMCP